MRGSQTALAWLGRQGQCQVLSLLQGQELVQKALQTLLLNESAWAELLQHSSLATQVQQLAVLLHDAERFLLLQWAILQQVQGLQLR